jgi:hypothetical protein
VASPARLRTSWKKVGDFHFGDNLFALRYIDEEGHALTVWLAPLAGRPEVVGVEILPAPPSVGSRLEHWGEHIASRAGEWFEALDAGRVQRISSVQAGSLPFKQFAKDLSEVRGRESGPWPITVTSHAGETSGYTPEEMGHVDYLVDAYVYASALAAGNSAPAKAVAEYRTIEHRSAQGRIAKARALGFLTEAPQGSRASVLTPKAMELWERMRKVGAIVDG